MDDQYQHSKKFCFFHPKTYLDFRTQHKFFHFYFLYSLCIQSLFSVAKNMKTKSIIVKKYCFQHHFGFYLGNIINRDIFMKIVKVLKKQFFIDDDFVHFFLISLL